MNFLRLNIFMDLQNIDKEILKEAVNQMIEENPQLFETVLMKVIDKKQENDTAPIDIDAVDSMIDKHFEKYDAVFRALA
jgi:hypothetical protein